MIWKCSRNGILKCFTLFPTSRSFSKIPPNGNIYLMGPPGAGKTTVGQLLSRKLDKTVLDVDNDHLENYWGMPVADKLKQIGPDSFVQAEGEALLNLNVSDSIISLSGSNPMHQQSMDHIRKNGTIVFMDVDNADILERLERMKVNRIVGQTTGMDMADILEFRRQFYLKNYDVRVVCEKGASAESISDKIEAELHHANSRKNYVSTRSSAQQINTFNDVTVKGLSQDGGLFVPDFEIPTLEMNQWETLLSQSYAERAITILEKWLHHSQLPPTVLRQFAESAYSDDNFSHSNVCPVVHLQDNLYVSELFHGPSASFKDMALQMLPHFFQHAVTQCDPNHRYLILVATSGDTGGAVLDGFSRFAKDVAVVVLYPENGISSIQKAQMTSVAGSNISVVGVESDFDFCQSTIKNIFTDQDFADKLQGKYQLKLSAANSINWARLLPQMAYHASSYLDLVKTGVISIGDEVDLCIPTGNFGNILGAYYAKSMGIPINRLICASNANNILTDFFNKGIYRIGTRQLLQTMSPAIDILKSSNLERYLYYKSGKNSNYITSLYKGLDNSGHFEIDKELLHSIQKDILADWCSETDIKETIKATFETTGMMIDPHTAVAKTVADRVNDHKRPIIISSTAHYAKFPEEVLTSIGHDVEYVKHNPVELLDKLDSMSLRPEMHDRMIELKKKERIHKDVCSAHTMAVKECVEDFVRKTS